MRCYAGPTAEAANASGAIFNVACGQQCPLLDLIASINRVLGTSIEPEFAEPRGGDARESLADISAARDVLGKSPVIDFDEGLRPSIEYYQSLPQAVPASRGPPLGFPVGHHNCGAITGYSLFLAGD